MTDPGTETATDTGTDPASQTGRQQDAVPQPAADVTKEQQPMTGDGRPAGDAAEDAADDVADTTDGEPIAEAGESAEAGHGATEQPAAEQPAAEQSAAEQPEPEQPAAEPAREPTGDAAVDEALEEFDRVTGAPLDTHIEVAGHVHQKLQNRLTDLGNA